MHSTKVCLIVADGFYEWKKEGTTKRPHRITLKDQELFGFAGLWDTWKSPTGEIVNSCTIITTTPNELMEPLHNRMPVILPREVEQVWLDQGIVYADNIIADKSRKINNSINDIAIREIYNEQKNLQAIMWYGETEFNGTILDDDKKGIRLRKGNMLIGDKNTVSQLFKEERFNGWFCGEIYILDEQLIPNARRDNFEQNGAFIFFTTTLKNICSTLSQNIRQISAERVKLRDCLSHENILNQDRIKQDIILQDNDELYDDLYEFDTFVEDDETQEDINFDDNLFRKIDAIVKKDDILTKYQQVLNLSRKLTVDQKKSLEKVFNIISSTCRKKTCEYLINKIIAIY